MADDTSEVLARSNSYLKFLQQLLCSISFKQILIFNQNRSPLLNGIFTNTAEIRDLRYSDKLQSKVSKLGDMQSYKRCWYARIIRILHRKKT